ncbi:glycosyltransferase family 4 protein [Candidatus Methylopumilus universalis]|uniref:glycosyltransferase family 4 protein n=1 Tax=Candidatus Methylopumilus universalis TaxID=2588536 RepID=UPI003BEF3366
MAFVTSNAFTLVNFRGPLIKELINKKVEVFAFAPDFDDFTRTQVSLLGAIPVDSHITRSNFTPFKDFFSIIKLSIQFKKYNLDAVFLYIIKPVIFGSIAAKIAKIPKIFAIIEGAGYVFTDHSRFSFFRWFLNKIVIFLYKISLNYTNKVFFLNKDDVQLFKKNRLIEPNKIILINGIGLNLSFFRYKKPYKKQLTFTIIARLLKEKGIYEFVDAARQIKNLNKNVKFLIVGSIDSNPSAISEFVVDAWVTEGLIEWVKHVNDIRPLLERTSVFVLPSYREGLPRSSQEAMALGRPIITTNVPGCKETVINRVNGFMVPAKNSQALFLAMHRFLEKPSLILNMGKESRKIAEKNFNVDKINQLILKSIQI